MSDNEDWSDDDDNNIQGAPPPPPQLANTNINSLQVQVNTMQVKKEEVIVPKLEEIKREEPKTVILCFLPIQLNINNNIELSGITYIYDIINNNYILMLYDKNKNIILYNILKLNSLTIDLLYDNISINIIDNIKIWKLIYRNKHECFKFIIYYCICMGITTNSVIKYDIVKIIDKKVKSVKLEHYIEVAYKIWNFNTNDLINQNFDDIENDTITTEIKVAEENEAPIVNSLAEMLLNQRIGTKKLIFSPFNELWLNELDIKPLDKSFTFISLEIVNVSKKSKLKKKKDKKQYLDTTSPAIDNLEISSVNEAKISISDEVKQNLEIITLKDDIAPILDETIIGEDNEINDENSKVVIIDTKLLTQSFKNCDEFELKSNYVSKYEEIIQKVNLLKDLKVTVVKDMHTALSQSQHTSSISIKLYKKAVGGLYDAIQRVILSLNAEEEFPDVIPDSVTLELEKTLTDIRIVIKESFTQFGNNLEEISSLFEQLVEDSKSENNQTPISDILSSDSLANFAGSPALMRASVETLVTNLQPLISNSISVPEAVAQLNLAEKEIEFLKVSYSLLLNDFKALFIENSKKASSHNEELFKPQINKLKSDVEKLKIALSKEKEAHNNDLKNFNDLQMKLATSNVEMDEELRTLRKEKKVLQDQIISLQAFEQGVVEMRALLDDAIVAKNEAIEDIDRLCVVQKSYNLTWIPENVIKYCMICQFKFKFFGGRSKKHCHYCGRVFCDICTSNKIKIPEFGFKEDVRVCNNCYEFKTTVDE